MSLYVKHYFIPGPVKIIGHFLSVLILKNPLKNSANKIIYREIVLEIRENSLITREISLTNSLIKFPVDQLEENDDLVYLRKHQI